MQRANVKSSARTTRGVGSASIFGASEHDNNKAIVRSVIDSDFTCLLESNYLCRFFKAILLELDKIDSSRNSQTTIISTIPDDLVKWLNG